MNICMNNSLTDYRNTLFLSAVSISVLCLLYFLSILFNLSITSIIHIILFILLFSCVFPFYVFSFYVYILFCSISFHVKLFLQHDTIHLNIISFTLSLSLPCWYTHYSSVHSLCIYLLFCLYTILFHYSLRL